MAESTIWWLLAGAAVALELVTGTFYLLMLALGMVAGALAAQLGLSLMAQMLLAALVGGGAVAACYWKRSRSPKADQAQSNRDVQMDIGETVHVHRWNADATASVKYRGAQWTVVLADGEAEPQPGLYQVRELSGSRLVVRKL